MNNFIAIPAHWLNLDLTPSEFRLLVTLKHLHFKNHSQPFRLSKVQLSVHAKVSYHTVKNAMKKISTIAKVTVCNGQENFFDF